MRRTRFTRLMAALMAVWLPLVMGEPAVVHTCRAHGTGSGTHASHGQQLATGESAHSEHAHHAASAAAHKTPEQSAPAHNHSACTCIGCCVGSASIALILAPDAITTETVAVVATAAHVTTGLLPRPGPEFSRPFSTGPPRA